MLIYERETFIDTGLFLKNIQSANSTDEIKKIHDKCILQDIEFQNIKIDQRIM